MRFTTFARQAALALGLLLAVAACRSSDSSSEDILRPAGGGGPITIGEVHDTPNVVATVTFVDYGGVMISVTVDNAGDIVVTGQEEAAPDNTDVWIRKYDDAGAEQWTTIHAGDAGLDDAGFGVAVDGQDNVVVVGFADADNVALNDWTASVSSNTVQWLAPGPQATLDWGRLLRFSFVSTAAPTGACEYVKPWVKPLPGAVTVSKTRPEAAAKPNGQ